MKTGMRHRIFREIKVWLGDPLRSVWVGLCVSGLGVMVQVTAAGADARPPNVVLILADDLGYGSLGCYGHAMIRTPHLDRLARGGVRFTDFHSNGPMCTPTRAALMTGRYQQRCRWVDDEELSPVFRQQRRENMKQRWAWGVAVDELTLAEVLKPAGYRTALIGKWHLGYDPKFHPMNQGFDEFRGFIAGAVDYHTHVSTSGLLELDWWNGRAVENEEGYTTDLLSGYGVEFIERNKDRPFFLFLAHAAPHVPLQGRDPKAKKPPVTIYQEMVEVLDESVGEIVEALRKHRLERETLVVFCSDNGPALLKGLPLTGGLRGQKGSLFEGGHRVPCIMSWPGVIPGGMTCDVPVMTMDLFPTFASLAGAGLPEGHEVDGMSLMPMLRGEAAVPERALHWLFAEDWAVRRGPWKLIGRGDEARQLLNLDEDLKEAVNRLGEQPALGKELHQLHKAWVEDVGDR